MKRLAFCLVAVALLRCSSHHCELATHWHAPRPHYDYVQSIELRANGTGALVMGEGQLVRTDVTVRYRAADNVLHLDYTRGSHAPARAVRYKLDTGDFVVDEPDYDGSRRHHYRCRVRFAENPFPPDVMSDDHLIYYACER